jgi:hypothetical protein
MFSEVGIVVWKSRFVDVDVRYKMDEAAVTRLKRSRLVITLCRTSMLRRRREIRIVVPGENAYGL